MRGKTPNTRSIDERPSIVDKKMQLGHWEGDTLEGKDKKGYLTTIVEKPRIVLKLCVRHAKDLLVVFQNNKQKQNLYNILCKFWSKPKGVVCSTPTRSLWASGARPN